MVGPAMTSSMPVQMNQPDIAASVGFMSGGDGNDLMHVFNDGAVSGVLDGGAGNDDIRVGRSLAPVTGADEFLGGGTVGGIDAGSWRRRHLRLG